MKLSDVFLLASAKLKIRKRRTIISALTISLLFGVVVAGLVISDSVMKGLDQVSQEMFEGKIYLITSRQVASYYTNQDVFRRANELYELSDNPEKSPPVVTKNELDETILPYLDVTNEFARKAVSEFLEKESDKTLELVEELIQEYGGRVVSKVGELRPKDGNYVDIEAFSMSNVSVYGSPISSYSDEMLKPMITIARTDMDEDSIPVIVPMNGAELILGMKRLPKKASLSERYVRMVEIMEKAPGVMFEGNVTTPTGELIGTVSYQMIGVSPTGGYIEVDSISNVNLINIFLTAIGTFNSTAMSIPESYIGEIEDDVFEFATKSSWSIDVAVEFDDVEKAVRYDRENDCGYIENGCDDLFVGEFITNRVDLYNMAEWIDKAMMWVAGFFGVIAVFIMAGILSRVIDDERQATAVYRAVGASKSDIRKIYLMYVLILSVMAAVMAIVIGYALSLGVHIAYSSELSASAKAVLGVRSEMKIGMVGFDIRILAIVAIMLGVGVTSALLSLDKIVSKNIIYDIKE